MYKTLISFILFFTSLIGGYSQNAYAHQNNQNIFGKFASDRDINMFHSRNKNVSSHVDLTEGQISQINNLLGREISSNAANYKKVYQRLHHNRKGGFIGNVYKIEQDTSEGKILLLVGLKDGKITKLRVSKYDSLSTNPIVTQDLVANFRNHTFKDFNYQLASIMNKPGKDSGGVFAYSAPFEKELSMEEKMRLKTWENKYSLLSLIQECLAINTVIDQ